MIIYDNLLASYCYCTSHAHCLWPSRDAQKCALITSSIISDSCLSLNLHCLQGSMCRGHMRLWMCLSALHNTVFGSKRSAICVQAVYFLHSTRPSLVSRDSVVDGDWLPATEWCQRYLPHCQPASDVAENLGKFLVRSVHVRGLTLNWFQR